MTPSVLRQMVYAAKSCTASGLGQRINNACKLAAGSYFDIWQKTYKTEGLEFKIPNKLTTRALRGKFVADTYELPERQLVRKHLPPDSCVLELGACIGVVSCLTNSLLTNRHAHVVIEANPYLIPYLQENRDANGAQFSIENCVISNAKEPVCLAVSPDMDSGRLGDEGNVVRVRTRTISEIEDSYGMSFNALVMDIEGSEREVLRENRVKLRSIDSVVVEFHPTFIGETETQSLRDILNEAGLRIVGKQLTTEAYRRV